MNFFEHQHQARQQTRKLIFLFVLAVLAILLAVNGALALIWQWAMPHSDDLIRTPYPRGFFWVNSGLVLLFILGGTLIEIFRLRDGGDAVAKMVGGRMVLPSSSVTEERRLLNVVQEMALAAGVACPKVYVLDQEDAINAFAAGYHQNEAVIAVTRGTLARLTRDELQGVVAHEFSHILNGDMRMNVQLIGVLFGIQMLAGFGQQLLQFGARMWGSSRSRDDKGPPLQLIVLAIGGTLFVVGYIGIFFGRLIKSAVSRQREFLADASAVQFTRNPDTIGGALRKIGGLSLVGAAGAAAGGGKGGGKGEGSRIQHPGAEQLSHLFLGAAKPALWSGLFATHPPLEERIARIFGRRLDMLDASIIETPSQPSTDRLPDLPYPGGALSGFGNADGATTLASTSTPSAAAIQSAQDLGVAFGHHAGLGGDAAQVSVLPAALELALRDTADACALVYAMLLSEGAEGTDGVADSVQARQLALLPERAQVLALYAAFGALTTSARLPLLDLAMPALRLMPQAERDAFLRQVDQLVLADARVTLPEFVVQTILCRRLEAGSARAKAPRYARLAQVQTECAVLLSMLAHSAAHAHAASPLDIFLRGAACMPELGLRASHLLPFADIQFAAVRLALDACSQLAPLQKPLLIKLLQAAAGQDETSLPLPVADLLRAMCAAIDAPMPPTLTQFYAATGVRGGV